MDEPTQKAVTQALDTAIATVAEEEFKSLSAGTSAPQIADRISCSLDALGELSASKMPNYKDKWLALFYSTWYQLRQINLTYSANKAMARIRDSGSAMLTKTGELHVVDYGCGTLAMQFAIALAASDAIAEECHLAYIRVDSHVTSQEMKELGNKIWNSFREEVDKDFSLAQVSKACALIMPGDEFPKRQGNEDIWLSAIHAVYENNQSEVTEWLNMLESDTNPDVGFITSHAYNKCLAKSVSPFERAKYKLLVANVQPQFRLQQPALRKTTEWRQSLRSICPDPFLNGPVPCEWKQTSFFIYKRR